VERLLARVALCPRRPYTRRDYVGGRATRRCRRLIAPGFVQPIDDRSLSRWALACDARGTADIIECGDKHSLPGPL